MKKKIKQLEKPIVISEEIIDDVDNQKILEIKKQTVCSEEERMVYDQVMITTMDDKKVKHILFIVEETNLGLVMRSVTKAWQGDMSKKTKTNLKRR